MNVTLPTLETLVALEAESGPTTPYLQHNVMLWRWINGASAMRAAGAPRKLALVQEVEWPEYRGLVTP